MMYGQLSNRESLRDLVLTVTSGTGPQSKIPNPSVGLPTPPNGTLFPNKLSSRASVSLHAAEDPAVRSPVSSWTAVSLL